MWIRSRVRLALLGSLGSLLFASTFGGAGGCSSEPTESVTGAGAVGEALGAATWTPQAITPQYSLMTAEFDAVPSSNDEDVVIGLSNGVPTDYPSIAASVRFASNGVIDARNGTTYGAVTSLAYAAGTTYHVAMVVDVSAKTYSVTVSPHGGAPVVIATNYAFRSEQSSVSVLNELSTGTAGAGTLTLSNVSAAAAWRNTPIAPQSGAFTAEFDATPLMATEDVVVGLSKAPAAAYTDVAAMVRFGVSGVIDVRNGGAYEALSSVSAAAGTKVHVRMVVDTQHKTYSVYVAPAGHAEVLLAQNAAFRNEQSTVTSLGNLAELGDPGDVAVSSVHVTATGGSDGGGGTGGGACPQGSALADGCTGAPAGSPQYPTLLDVHRVVMLNILPGSGYTNGTYNWTASGGGGSGAAGTVTVSSGLLGGKDSLKYTISNPGSGYTSRPSIVVAGLTGGSGGSIVPSVYQATPHNAATPWNMPGVDYHVGIPSGTTLKDPTVAANLPAGASYASSTVKVTGCNVTLDGFDFTLHKTAVNVDVSSTSCTTTIQNSKFSAGGTSLQTIAKLTHLGSGGAFLFQRNEYDGLAANGGSGSGFAVNDPIEGSGKVTLLYNYFHNFDSKVIQLSGTASSMPLTEKYNLFADFGSCTGGCAHGEAEYTYSSAGSTLSMTLQFNTYVLHFHNGGSDLTAPQAVQADAVNIDGSTDDHNVIFAPGPQKTCNQNNQKAYTAAAAVFDGQQEGGKISNVSFAFNYIDNSGTYFPWYRATGTGVSHTNNVDSGSGGPCNCNTVAGDGSCN